MNRRSGSRGKAPAQFRVLRPRAEFDAFTRAGLAKWAKVIKEANIRVDLL